MKSILKNKNTWIIIASLIGIVIVFIRLSLINKAIDKINEERCYNLPLNEFYEDKSCLKYTQTWEELLGE